SRLMGSAKYALMVLFPIAAKRRLPFWSLIPRASCYVPGAGHPIQASSGANAKPKQAASGRLVSTVFMWTRTTTSGSLETQLRGLAAGVRMEQKRGGQLIEQGAMDLS